MSAPASASAVAPKASVEHHLKTALQELTQRQHDIDEQLNRIDALQSEKETITRQIDAVTAALQAFQR
jgi:chaperonin cofactor prefoldin